MRSITKRNEGFGQAGDIRIGKGFASFSRYVGDEEFVMRSWRRGAEEVRSEELGMRSWR